MMAADVARRGQFLFDLLLHLQHFMIRVKDDQAATGLSAEHDRLDGNDDVPALATDHFIAEFLGREQFFEARFLPAEDIERLADQAVRGFVEQFFGFFVDQFDPVGVVADDDAGTDFVQQYLPLIDQHATGSPRRIRCRARRLGTCDM